jgi:peptidoglycan LD-endopeptidase CwlK
LSAEHLLSQALDYDAFTVAAVITNQPEPSPTLGLYEPKVNIDIGTTGIKQCINKTGDDPILVAAAYKAGGIYKNTHNPWHLRTYADHLDRAAQWYGDACAVLKEVQV